MIWIVGLLPGKAEWNTRIGMNAYNAILGSTPRIVLASLLADWAGSFSNSFVLARMKVLTQGPWLWTCTIGSTLVSEGVDTLIFVSVAYFGPMSNDALWPIAWSNYVFKVGIEVVFTPVTYAVIAWLKRSEGVDTFDARTDFNPFRLVTSTDG